MFGKKRRCVRLWHVTLAGCIGLAGLYYGYFAEDRFAAEARFIVQADREGAAGLAPSGGILALLTGSSSGHDQMAVRHWLQTPAAVKALSSRLSLQEHLSGSGRDPFWSLSTNATVEQLERRLKALTEIHYDTQANVSMLRVEGFSADRAKQMADTILSEAAAQLQRISHDLAEEDLRFARSEVEVAERRVHNAREAMIRFQNTSGDFDPRATSRGTLEIIGSLEGKATSLRADIAGLLTRMRENTPEVVAARASLKDIERQITLARSALAGPDGDQNRLNDVLSSYRSLQTEIEFAERAHATALAGLDAARSRTGRAQKRLVVIASPVLPEEDLWRRRIEGFIGTALAAALVHAILLGSLSILRDHRA